MGGLSFKVGRVVYKSGASCLLKVGRVVLGRVFCGASCLGASFMCKHTNKCDQLCHMTCKPKVEPTII